jgi:hypothetical protein
MQQPGQDTHPGPATALTGTTSDPTCKVMTVHFFWRSPESPTAQVSLRQMRVTCQQPEITLGVSRTHRWPAPEAPLTTLGLKGEPFCPISDKTHK